MPVVPGGLLDLEQDRTGCTGSKVKSFGERISVKSKQYGQAPTKQAGSRREIQTQRNLSALENQSMNFSGPSILGSKSWGREKIEPWARAVS